MARWCTWRFARSASITSAKFFSPFCAARPGVAHATTAKINILEIKYERDSAAPRAPSYTSEDGKFAVVLTRTETAVSRYYGSIPRTDERLSVSETLRTSNNLPARSRRCWKKGRLHFFLSAFIARCTFCKQKI